MNLVQAQADIFTKEETARVLQFASPSFDAFVWELGLSLMTGGALYLARPGQLAAFDLPRTLSQHRISMVTLPPSLLAQLGSHSFPHLRAIVSAGEACPLDIVQRWAPGRRFLNGYGPTEGTICASIAVCQATDGAVRIGRPLRNTRLYVLSEQGEPVPAGIPGELYIGGAGVARGYLQRPELTDKRFVPDVFCQAARARMYRTGDLVRWTQDGELEYLGRIDQQVKLRGYRIELEEIAEILRGHAEVQAAVVVVRGDSLDDRRLVAYVVSRSPVPPPINELLSAARQKLPEFMVPAAVVFLKELPLTPNGKIDQKALPDPRAAQPEPAAKPQGAPRTATERELAVVWKDLLRVKNVDVDENFFSLGGDSLSAIRLAGQVREHFKIEIPLSEFTTSFSIAAMAAYIDAHRTVKPAEPTLSKAAVIKDAPLSFAQEGIWFVQQMAPESCAYNYPAFFRLKGRLDVAALERSLHELSSRHGALRTAFVEVEGRPQQRIVVERALRLATRDAMALSTAELRVLIDEEAQRPFNLEKDPLIRATLLRLDDSEYLLLLVLHHIITDGWSMNILYREMEWLYGAATAGQEFKLAPLLSAHTDFVIQEQQALAQGHFAKDLEFWRKYLDGAPEVLPLPLDRPRPAVRTFAGATVDFKIDGESVRRLRELASAEGTTVNMVMLAAFFTLLYRYTAQEDILLAVPHLNRSQKNEGVMGCFVHALVLRGQLSAAMSFRELLTAVRKSSLTAYDHAALPFEQILKVLHPSRDINRSPLVQVAFAPQVSELGRLSLPGLSIEPVKFDSGKSAFDMTLYFWESATGISALLEYSTAIFARATLEAMAGHLLELLRGAAENPRCTLSELPLLTEQERELLLSRFNPLSTPIPGTLLHELFMEQVRYAPRATALVSGAQSQSYAQLDALSSQLAQKLLSFGLRPDSIVALCMERSIELIVSMFAVLKAGAAFLPLDPAYPRERLEFMLKDSQASLLLSSSQVLPSLDVPAGCQLILTDGLASQTAALPVTVPTTAVRPSHLAYVIYTSGSTGRPKGVMVEHRSVVNLVIEQAKAFQVTPSSRVLQLASPSFDAAISEVMVTLCKGATLYLAPSRQLGAYELPRTLLQHRITLVTVPPSLLAQVPQQAFPHLQTLVVAGEACPAELVQRWAPGRRFLNAYGPTEGTVCASYSECTLDERAPRIGRPLGNVRLYVLDSHQQLLPIGVPGELYIGGECLARGYLGRPELTAQRFVKDVYSGKEGARMYRSGDLVKWNAEGELEYLGRIDGQVKLRGYRVEPEEIASVLSGHPKVQAAAVVLQGEQADDKRLVAYVVPRKSAEKPPKLPEGVELWPSVAEFFVYDAVLYYAMTHDERRNARYRAAVQKCVSGRVVVDIGTGADAILARMCVEAGAAKVYAIELLAESYKRAQRRIEELGLKDRIILIHGDATQVELPEPADVCVSEIVGPIGGSEGAAWIINKCRRFLRPGGVMIPERSLTRIAAVTLPDTLMAQPTFTPLTGGYVEKIFAQVGRRFDLRLCVRGLSAQNLISNSDVFEDLDYRKEVPVEAQHQVKLTIAKAARLDGFLVWLNLFTNQDEVIDILEAEYCWLPVFLPAFELGVEVPAGTAVELQITRRLSENGLNPDFLLQGLLHFPDGSHRPFEYLAAHAAKTYQGLPYYQKLFAAPPPAEEGDSELLLNALREHARQKLPDFMVPAAFVLLDKLPLTKNGKLDLRALPAPDGRRPALAQVFTAPRTATEKALAGIWGEVLQVSQVGIDDPFFDLGGNSLMLVRVRALIQARLSRTLELVMLFQLGTVRRIAAHLEQVEGGAAVEPPPPPPSRQSLPPRGGVREPIAIIGMAGRFPGAADIPALWRLLLKGEEAISHLSAEELSELGADPKLVSQPGFVPAMGRLQGVFDFDADFFGYSPQDAKLIDPQHRLLLECAWAALENAGYDPANSTAVPVGVFTGAGAPRYWLERVSQLRVAPGSIDMFRTALGNSHDFLATRISHKLGLRGPSLNIYTACSTSLVAVHLACQSLLAGECDMALSGGASVASLDQAGYVYEEGSILSPEGRCRPFDAKASGTVPGSGVALVVLKRLSDAQRDGDSIYAVIRSSAINNDGAQKVGFTAPSVQGQAEVIERALERAELTADAIGLLEAHGTATAIGDPIEVAALVQAFSRHTARSGFCALGSIKSNLGHLDAAAGVTGLIKATLALHHGMIPKSLHMQRPNPMLHLEESPFYVPTAAQPWPRGEVPRRAGVSSFGIGGTNAHVILEEAPESEVFGASRPAQLLLLSARNEQALDLSAQRLREHLLEHPGVSLPDVAFTLQNGRSQFGRRMALVCRSREQAAELLQLRPSGRVYTSSRSARPLNLVFMFPGGGSQRVGMGQELYGSEPVYREAFDRCATLFLQQLGEDVRMLLFPAPEQTEAAAERLLQPSLNMAAIFTTEYALTNLLLSLGVRPALVTGHSLGEYTAAWLAGVLSLEDAVTLVALRGQLSDSMPPSTMLSVNLSEEKLIPWLRPGLSLAAVNSPQHCVVSGEAAAISTLAAELSRAEVHYQQIPMAMAPHSELVEPFMAQLSGRATKMTLRPPNLPLVSNLNGRLLSEEDARDPTHWARHLRNTVRFMDGLTTLLDDPNAILMEVRGQDFSPAASVKTPRLGFSQRGT